jgi:hypothetical protein
LDDLQRLGRIQAARRQPGVKRDAKTWRGATSPAKQLEDGVRKTVVGIFGILVAASAAECLGQVLGDGADRTVTSTMMSRWDANIAAYFHTIVGFAVGLTILSALIVPTLDRDWRWRFVLWQRCLFPAFVFGAIAFVMTVVPLVRPTWLPGFLEEGIKVSHEYFANLHIPFAYHGVLSGLFLGSGPLGAQPFLVALAAFLTTVSAGAATWLLQKLYSRYGNTPEGKARRVYRVVRRQRLGGS